MITYLEVLSPLSTRPALQTCNLWRGEFQYIILNIYYQNKNKNKNIIVV